MDSNEYDISTRGIYYTTRAYHDELDYHWVVDFNKPNVDEQFREFKRRIEENGAKRAMRELKQQFKTLRELLS